MTHNPAYIFDTNALLRNRRRAAKTGNEHDFLKREIADRLQDRLQDINRTFAHVLDIGGEYACYTNSLPSITCRDIADDSLNLPESTYDLAVSNLLMHWVNDLPGLLIQINRALKPDGLFMAAMFGGDTLTELRHALLAAESEITGGAHARVMPFAEVRDLGSLLQRAGFALPVTDMDTLTVQYENPMKLLIDLRGMGEASALLDRPKTFLRRDILMRAMEIYSRDYSGPDGRVRATFQILYMTGWHPHDSQQKPLKPGSAKMRLADALKAETPGNSKP